jgi:acetylornithine/succinyldiaminopimelate/putrescine aminotransferase
VIVCDGGNAGFYRPAGHTTRALLSELILEKQPIFAMPAWFVTRETAEVGFMLSEALRELSGGVRGDVYRTFFANSCHEAIHGAIKLARHSAASSFAEHGGRILVLDAADRLRSWFDPCNEGPADALVPGVELVATAEAFQDRLTSGRYCGALLAHRGDAAGGRDEIAGVLPALERHRRHGGLVMLDLSQLDVSLRGGADSVIEALRPELFVVGERLTDHEIPFAAFSGTCAAFSAWSQPGAAFIHTNTYGGNTLAMRKVAARLRARWTATDDDAARVRQLLTRAETDWGVVLELYGRHVNPATEALHRSLHGLLHVVRAEGSRLRVELDSGRHIDVVDGVCGGGLGVNGHNPRDAITDVLDRHDPSVDYVGRLETVLAGETGLARCFPGVSGAGAVDTALTLAVLAHKRRNGSQAAERKRIIVFHHNYAGKTLISLVATAAQATRAPFGPLYQHVRYLDPFAGDAAAQLEDELASDRVALVWLELVHGSSLSFSAIPDELLSIVARERERRGFLVGVDEILTSYYRCGRRFAFKGRLPAVDIVTVSKALSYMCFPMAATLVSEEVYERARAANPRHVDQLKRRYANALGAHFALHSIAQVDALQLESRTAALARTVQDEVRSLAPRSSSLGRRFAEGLLVRLEVLPPKLLSKLPRRLADRATALFAHSVIVWWVARARAFILYDCFGIPLIATLDEVEHVMAGVRELSQVSPMRILWEGISFSLTEQLAARKRSLVRSGSAAFSRWQARPQTP